MFELYTKSKLNLLLEGGLLMNKMVQDKLEIASIPIVSRLTDVLLCSYLKLPFAIILHAAEIWDDRKTKCSTIEVKLCGIFLGKIV